MPGNCVNPISFSPTTGVVLKTYIKVSITGCFDLDQQDYPLKYSFGYNNGIRDNPITTLNGNNEINSIFPTGSLYPYTTVCDSLGDCNTIRSAKVLKINSSRRLQISDDLMNEYKKNIQFFGIINTVNIYLNSFELDESLIELIWTDFVDFVEAETLNTNLFNTVTIMISDFMNTLQASTLTYENIEKYTNFVIAKIKIIKSLESSSLSQLVEIADRIIRINSEVKYVELAQKLVNTMLDACTFPISMPVTFYTEHVSIYKIENKEKLIANTLFKVGRNTITINDLGLDDATLIVAKASAYTSQNSDTVSLSLTSYENYENYQFVAVSEYELSLKNGVSIVLYSDKPNDKDCEVLTTNGNKESCEVVSRASDSLTIKGTKSGVYYLTDSVQNSIVPAYVIISLSIFALVFSAFFLYIDNKSSYAGQTVLESHITEVAPSDRNSKSGSVSALDITSDQINNSNILSGHAIFRIFSNNSKFSRSKRIFLLVSIVLSEVFVQNLLLTYKIISNSLHPALVGLISVAALFSVSLGCTMLLSKKDKIKNFIGLGILVALQGVSIVGSFFIPFTNLWPFALLSGIVAEIIVSQTLVVCITKV